MKTVLIASVLLLGSIAAAAAQQYGTGSNPNSHYVAPHYTSSGTYVAPHYQTNPNNTQRDNYGTVGNVNPYTGVVGTRSPRY